MNCSHCDSEQIVKNGKVATRQRYLCKNCGYQFSIEFSKTQKSKIRLAVELYLEGLSLREISHFLDVSHVAIYNWLNNFSPELDTIRNENKLITITESELTTVINPSSPVLLININEAKSFMLSFRKKSLFA